MFHIRYDGSVSDEEGFAVLLAAMPRRFVSGSVAPTTKQWTPEQVSGPRQPPSVARSVRSAATNLKSPFSIGSTPVVVFAAWKTARSPIFSAADTLATRCAVAVPDSRSAPRRWRG